jgi:ribonuclease HII
MKIAQNWVIGIDEVGRGPLAGPVAVGAVLVSHDFDWDLLPGVGDSKKVTQKNREAIFLRAQELKKEGKLSYAVGLVPATTIDRIGIVPSIRKAMQQALTKIQTPSFPRGTLGKKIPRVPLGKDFFDDVLVKLDGGLKAPGEFVNQETIIKGDSKEKVIGLASIMAKVTRDRYMTKLTEVSGLQKYNFDIHKGYGTKAHREAIMEYGLSKEHRVSFCKNLKK